jgi:O-antigen/teichoic acid export membrane protein
MARPPREFVSTAADPGAAPVPELSGVGVVLRGFAVLTAATVVARLIGFAVLALVARKVGPDAFGAYNFALGIAAFLVGIPSNFGIGTLAIRDIASEPGVARRVVGEALALQAALAVACLAILLALSSLLSSNADVRTLLPTVGIYYVVYTLTADWALQGLQRLRAVAFVRLAGQIVFGAVTPLILVSGFAGVQRYAWMMVVGAATTAVLALALVWRYTGAPSLPRSAAALGGRVWRSAPIGFSLVMLQIYYSFDAILLGYLKNTGEVGQYSAAAKLPVVMAGLLTVWASALYPHATKLYKRDPDVLRRQVGKFSSLALVAALPLAVGSSFVADDLMTGLFGGQFGPAGTPFAVLMWSTAIVFVSINMAQVILAIGQERYFALAVTVGAVVNTILNFILIPPFGPTGAAFATMVAEAVVLAVNARRLFDELGPTPLSVRRIAGALAASAVMALTLAVMPAGTSVWIRLVVAFVVYAAGAVAFRAVRRSDAAVFRGQE